MSSNINIAWDDFWAQHKRGNQKGGCLPAGWQPIDAARQAAWQDFSKHIALNVRVLDLATGDGCVMKWLLKLRSDLKLTGVDLAPSLPAAPKGTKMRGGISMEKLPFKNGYFGAVTSQFGFEYSDLPRAAAELARVLSADGICGLITHRLDGPILEHNRKRQEQITWAIEKQDLVNMAKRSLSLRSAGFTAIPPAIANAPREGAEKFGSDSAAWEIAEAVVQTLRLGARDHPINVATTLDVIKSRASNELGRITSLTVACEQTADEKGFNTALEDSGLEQTNIKAIIDETTGLTFADFRTIAHTLPK